MTRRDNLFATLHSNPKAPFVTRVVQFGSEPLFDGVLTPAQLSTQVIKAKRNLSSIGIPVTVSELAYGYQKDGGAQNVLNAIDSINVHMLPFFASNATTGMYLLPLSMPFIPTPSYARLLPLGSQAWGNVLTDLDFFIQNGNGKKMYFDEVKISFHLGHHPLLKASIFHLCTRRMAGLPSRILEWSPTVTPPSPVSAASKNIFPSSTPTAPTSRLSLAVALVGSLTSIRTHRSQVMGFTAFLGSSSFPSRRGRPAERRYSQGGTPSEAIASPSLRQQIGLSFIRDIFFLLLPCSLCHC